MKRASGLVLLAAVASAPLAYAQVKGTPTISPTVTVAPPKLTAPMLTVMPPPPATTPSGPPSVAPPDPAVPPPPPAAPGTMTERGLVTDPGPQTAISVAVDPSGAIYILYKDGRDNTILLRKLDALGNPVWSAGTRITGATGGKVVAGNDGALVVESSVVTRVSGAGAIEWRTALGQSAGGNVYAAYDGAGGAFVAFLPYPSAGGRYLKRVDRYGRIVVNQSSSRFECGPSQVDGDAVADGAGGVFVVCGGDEIIVRKFSATGATVWSTPATAVYGAKNRPAIALDGKGGVVVTWHDARRRALARDLFVQGLDATGRARWTPNGVEVARDVSLVAPQVVDDANWGAWVMYGTASAFVRRVDNSGVLATPALMAGDTTGTNPTDLAKDVAGGVLTVSRTGSAWGCFSVTRFDRAGASVLARRPGGTCRGPYFGPLFAAVVATQPVVVYEDDRAGYADVYLWR